MLTTVTLNPAIDLFLRTPEIALDTVLRSEADVRRAGGKGINVSRMLMVLGEPSRAFVAAGGGTGEELVHLGRREGLEVDAIPGGGVTRINVVIEESSTGRRLKVNSPGAEVPPSVLESLASLIQREAPTMSGLVLAGSLPPGLPHDAYAVLIRIAREHGIPVFLDASGEALRQAIPETPEVVKVNRAELEDLRGEPVGDDAQFGSIIAEYFRQGVRCCCVTLGPDGALLGDETGLWRTRSPQRSERRPVGAGDCFLAGLASGWLQGIRGAELAARATACGTAWATHEDGSPPALDGIAELQKEVVVEPLEMRAG